MYRLIVMRNKRWVWGIKTYETLEEANNRVIELQKIGIKAEVRLSEELFN